MDKQKQLLASLIVNLARNAGTSGSRYTYMNAAATITQMKEAEFKRHVKLNDWDTIKGFGPSLSDSIGQFIRKGKITKTINTPDGRKSRLTVKPGVMLDDGSHRVRRKKPRAKYTKLAAYLGRYLKSNGIEYEYVGSWVRKEPSIANLDIMVADTVSVEKLVAILSDSKSLKTNIISLRKDSVSIKIKYLDEPFLNVSIFLASKKYWGAYRLAYTGSPNFIIFLRTMANKLGYSLKVDGLYKDNRRIAAKSEELIFKRLHLDYIPPHKRNYD